MATAAHQARLNLTNRNKDRVYAEADVFCCSVCEVQKVHTEFILDKYSHTGHSRRCKLCDAEFRRSEKGMQKKKFIKALKATHRSNNISTQVDLSIPTLCVKCGEIKSLGEFVKNLSIGG